MIKKMEKERKRMEGSKSIMVLCILEVFLCFFMANTHDDIPNVCMFEHIHMTINTMNDEK